MWRGKETLPDQEAIKRPILAKSPYHISREKTPLKTRGGGTSLAIQRLRLGTPNAGGMGSIPGRETNIPHAERRGI